MAQVKYQCEFYSNNTTRYRINIYHVDYTNTIVEFKGGMDGFIPPPLEQQPQEIYIKIYYRIMNLKCL